MFKFKEVGPSPVKPDRSEQIVVALELSYAKSLEYQLELDLLLKDQPDERDKMVPSDILRVKWKFNALYLNGVDRQIEAVLRLLPVADLIKSVDVKELVYGRSLIMDVSEKLSRLIEALEAR